jgi:alpha-L-arabinofuranosidase
MFQRRFFFLLIIGILSMSTMQAQPVKEISVKINQKLNPVPAAMWGIFFEDINFAADGGIYAELVKNRSFSFNDPMMGWKWLKKGEGDGEGRLYNSGNLMLPNKRYVRLQSTVENGAFGLSNEGFRGIGVKKDAEYRFTVTARNGDSNAAANLVVELADATGKVLAESAITGIPKAWKKFEVILKPVITDSQAHLNVVVKGKGLIEIETVSLFPVDTWKGRKNGLRRDLVQLLADMKPGFVRFPGGCIVEGRELATRYQWKKTVGDPESRELIVNRWNTEFKHRLTPDYFQSFGLGFFEYFLLAEDIGAEPLPILNCGMACQYNTGELTAPENLYPFIQDALDLIEFANGAVTTQWGKLRASMGHPEPFNLKMMGIGNEQWGPQYVERLKSFNTVLKAKHPEIKLITSAGPAPEGDKFSYLWGELNQLNVDFVDEHYYQSPSWFLNNAGRYDAYNRKGPKVFAGEYAAHSKGETDPVSRNNWDSALAEAAFMTGLERNCDVVQMCSYAPLLAHKDAWQWNPDLIWFDNLKAVATPNYYVQKIFATNKGSYTVPILIDNGFISGKDSLYATAAVDESSKELILKLVNVSQKSVPLKFVFSGGSVKNQTAAMEVLKSDELTAYNSFLSPVNLVTEVKNINVTSKSLTLTLDGQSVNVLRIKR